MELVLDEQLFTDDEYTVRYGNRSATFVIIDEEFAGNNRLGRVNRINVVVREYGDGWQEIAVKIGMPVIGMGDGIVGVRTGEAALRGKLLSRDNMAQCVVILYEEA
jgi:hypothetical protein